MPVPFPLSWLVGPVLVLLVGGAGYLAGDYDRNNAWLAKQALVERQAHAAYEAEVQRGQAAASKSIAKERAMQTSFETLEVKFDELRKRAPLVVYRPGAPAIQTTQGGAQPSVTGAGADAGTVAGAPGGAPGLTLAAVWMWNSALAATDMPAGACGAADTATEACAADSGIDLAAAWANQAMNAKTCALDRLRHQQLIDYLTPPVKVGNP